MKSWPTVDGTPWMRRTPHLPAAPNRFFTRRSTWLGEAPVDVAVPDVAAGLGEEWSAFDTNTMGEFQISVLLNEGDVSSRQADQAAAGWGGDRYVVVGTTDKDVIVWNSEWDTEKDAAEFAETLGVRESGRLDAPAEATDDTTLIVSDDAVVRIVIEGTSVSYVSAPDRLILETGGHDRGSRDPGILTRRLCPPLDSARNHIRPAVRTETTGSKVGVRTVTISLRLAISDLICNPYPART